MTSNASDEGGSHFTIYKFIKATVIFGDGEGKFYQSETKVVPCIPSPQCRQMLCEECFTLQDESLIPEEDRVRISLPPPPSAPVEVIVPSAPPSSPPKGRIFFPNPFVP